MIPVARVPEPERFDRDCRQRGKRWFAERGDGERPRDYWSPFRTALAQGFGERCGYLGMLITSGHVDHYRSLRTHRELAYEWDNYRYVDSSINQCKGSLGEELLDPYEIEEGWFVIELPGLQMRISERVPEPLRARARFTLDRLQLRDGESAIRYRRQWLAMYESGKLALEGLAQVAPLLAEAVRRRDARSPSEPTP
jgi:hypothetical protein